MDCGVTNCENYNKECFIQTVLVRKPDPKTGCSYFRKLKKKQKNSSDQTQTTNDAAGYKSKTQKKKLKSKKEKNSLKEIM